MAEPAVWSDAKLRRGASLPWVVAVLGLACTVSGAGLLAADSFDGALMVGALFVVLGLVLVLGALLPFRPRWLRDLLAGGDDELWTPRDIPLPVPVEARRISEQPRPGARSVGLLPVEAPVVTRGPVGSGADSVGGHLGLHDDPAAPVDPAAKRCKICGLPMIAGGRACRVHGVP